MREVQYLPTPSSPGNMTYTERVFRSQRRKQLADEVWGAEPTVRRIEKEADEEAAEIRVPLFESSSKPHIYTADERTRMALYDSIDYWDSHNLVYKEYLHERQKQPRWIKWLVYLAIGFAVGLWAFFFFQTLDAVNGGKVAAFEGIVKAVTESMGPDTSLHRTPGGVPYAAAFCGLVIYLLFAMILGLGSSSLCWLFPPAAGSGVPDVMAYLNGVLIPKIFNVRVFCIKTVSCIFAVGSGLPVGAEGPTIHIGALIGAALPQGRSKTLRRHFIPALKIFNSPESQRDFISAGAAAGVTAAFGSPIGGLLFVMEEIASFFPVKLAWMVFTSCLACMIVIQFTDSYLKGWKPTDRSEVFYGTFLDSSISLFNTDFSFEQVPLNLLTFIPTVIIGIIMGLVAIFFTVVNVKCLRMRAKYISVRTATKLLEPPVFACFYITIAFLLTLPFGCRELPPLVEDVKERLDIDFIRSLCANPETEYHPLASLTLTSAYNDLRLLYSRNTAGLFVWYELLIFQFLYTLGACYTSGMFIASGVVIPTLLIGAIGGRLIGEVMNQSWSEPGVVALIGSAGFFGGLSRLTFSLAVIMMELTSDLSHIVMLIVAVIISKGIADQLTHSLYHQIIEFKCVPFLDMQTDIHRLDAFPTSVIMAKAPKTVRSTESVKRITQLLLDTTHNCFPVVSIADNSTFRGTIQRKELQTLLWFSYMERDNPEPSRHATYKQLDEVREKITWDNLPPLPENLPDSMMNALVDLNPYIDTAAFFTREHTCLSRSYYLFRHMGLRHLVVVDRACKVVGILSRKDFVMDKVFDKIEAFTKSTVVESDDDEEEEENEALLQEKLLEKD